MILWSEERPSEEFRRVFAPDGSLVGDPSDLDDELRESRGRRPRTIDEHLPFDDRPEPPVNFSSGCVPLGADLPNTVDSALADKLRDAVPAAVFTTSEDGSDAYLLFNKYI